MAGSFSLALRFSSACDAEGPGAAVPISRAAEGPECGAAQEFLGGAEFGILNTSTCIPSSAVPRLRGKRMLINRALTKDKAG